MVAHVAQMMQQKMFVPRVNLYCERWALCEVMWRSRKEGGLTGRFKVPRRSIVCSKAKCSDKLPLQGINRKIHTKSGQVNMKSAYL